MKRRSFIGGVVAAAVGAKAARAEKKRPLYCIKSIWIGDAVQWMSHWTVDNVTFQFSGTVDRVTGVTAWSRDYHGVESASWAHPTVCSSEHGEVDSYVYVISEYRYTIRFHVEDGWLEIISFEKRRLGC